jgi:hypothetical protein
MARGHCKRREGEAVDTPFSLLMVDAGIATVEADSNLAYKLHDDITRALCRPISSKEGRSPHCFLAGRIEHIVD